MSRNVTERKIEVYDTKCTQTKGKVGPTLEKNDINSAS